MYVQITTRCNMTCSHCGFSCTKKGTDMSLTTFNNALKYCDEIITIGGGEPTLHPKFWEIIAKSIAHYDVWLATNGSITDSALTLAKMAAKGVLACDLSLDDYHDPIDPKVIQAFQNNKKNYLTQNDNDSRGVRNVNGSEVNAGRCDFGIDDCICEDIIIKPNGDVKACGCVDAPTFGNVNTAVNIPDEWDRNECYKKQELCA